MGVATAQLSGSRLGFKSHLRVHTVPGEGVYLVSERGVTALHGSAITALAPLLDGTRDLDKLLADTAGVLAAPQVTRIVTRLTEGGFLTHLPGLAAAVPAADRAYWELAGLDGHHAARSVAEGSVAVLALGGGDGTGLSEALRASGVPVSGVQVSDAPVESASVRPGTAPLTVVVCQDYLDPALAEVDAAQRAAGKPWLVVRSGGADPWIGPVLRPGKGPCWHCLAHWLRLNRRAETYLQHAAGLEGPVPPPPSASPAGHASGLHLAALEAAKWLAGHRYPGQDAIWTLDSLTLGGRHHPARQRPQCPACGNPGLVAERVTSPMTPRSRPKAAQTGGGDRALTPQQVLERYGHLVGPLTGVVTALRRDTRGPDFLNCFHAGHNPVATPTGLASVRAGLRSRSSGKGTTPLDAQVSALCEAVERHSGFFQGDEPTVRAAYRDIAAEAVHPDTIQLFDQRQFDGRTAWNAAHGPFHQVCAPFDSSAEIDWTPVWSLTAGRHRLLPTALLYYNVPDPSCRGMCSANSNGTAAGSSPEDALVQGFLELVERDAVAQWWYNRTRRAGLDLDAFGDSWTTRLREVHAGLGRTVWALDLTTDLGIPVFAALSRRTDKPAQDIALGFGAHFDPRTALRRALTELNQMLPPLVAVRADGSGYSCDDPAALTWWRTATVDSEPYLRPTGQPTTPDTHPCTPRGDLREDVAAIEELVRRRGMELLVLDQTRPDLELPVVKVIVPGLRPFWTRFAPGRLFDVPVRQGLLASPTRYEDLNPRPLFM
ncbi:TOMM precursor leader peptide-binding protein [Streptomyces sp. LHD-70]|uniref:TOMM precursor leader peptide-binding protein n=1 Tax=Streptomyces sp. LHD-70 TaxID=3072140 RepID=UPI0035BE6009